MTTLIESYEQQYSSLSADITVCIGKITNSLGGEKQSLVRHIEKLFDELGELLEQMELEIKDLPAKDKQKYRTRLASYKAENKKLLSDMGHYTNLDEAVVGPIQLIGLGRTLELYETENKKLSSEMKRAKLGLNARDELLGTDDCNDSEDQRTRLLDNTEKLERGSRQLEQGYRVILETEEMGAQMLTDLHDQRQTIQRARNRLEETNTNLGKSSRVLSGMLKRIIQNRILLVFVCLVIIFVIILAIYFTVKKKS